MLSFLKNHPFAVEATFESSLVLTFAFSKEHLQELIPPCLSLDTFNDKWAFCAVAMVQTKNLRPKGFPLFLGNDFFLIGYRIFVRYQNKKGKNLRGLYILKSETDKKKMEWLGNLFTHYKYTTTDICLATTGTNMEISSLLSDFHLIANLNQDNISLPEHSPFKDWKEARHFAGPLPFTFSVNKDSNDVLIIEGVRTNWIPTPLNVIEQHFSFFKSFQLENPVLANAFIIKNIPYYWKKGYIEKWEK